jgi:flagellar biosynthesis anti-sigma factor FlgM
MSGNNRHQSGAKARGKPPHRRAKIQVCPDSSEEDSPLLSKAREVVYRTPEVRPKKVAALKEAIERGVYVIDSRKIAEIIVREWFPRR